MRAAPVLDISGRISKGGERGLLGLAFPPGDAALRRFYIHYTDPTGDIVIARVQWDGASAVADPKSVTPVLKVSHREFPNHNGGQLAFGPDGMLYAGPGDGGGGGDPHDRAQNLGDLHGKLLRIDVEGGSPTYSVPTSNPFVGRKGARGEVFAYGLRNPWRFSFDRATGDLWIGDVGQDAWEEIDLIPAGSPGGQDFGWRRYEGNHPYPPGSAAASKTGLTFPVAEYPHAVGECVIGGYVYRGTSIPALAGLYVFGDNTKGQVFALRETDGAWEQATLLQTSLGITSFGEDEQGELYLCASDGSLYRITGSR
jgi:glucose/arabinose dehydrogenase